jgi:peptidoglycan/xylan/chitin deacetylase (PgdA/CDA1 family)
MHKRYAYSPIVGRSIYTWPNGKRLAVYIAINVESYRFSDGLLEELLPSGPMPDILNYAWCDYGNRVGIWRLFQLIEDLTLPITLLVNSDIYSTTPGLLTPFRKRGDEIACHGRTNSERQGTLSVPDETLLIAEATRILTEHEGKPPAGWLSPWISETNATLDLLKEAGYRYVLDWCCDDQPFWLRTASGPLLSVPYPQEINDSSTVIGRLANAQQFSDMIIDQFDEMQEQSKQQPLVMGIALHSHISGQPFRLRALRRALEHVAKSRGQIWLTRAGAIAEYASQLLSIEAV